MTINNPHWWSFTFSSTIPRQLCTWNPLCLDGTVQVQEYMVQSTSAVMHAVSCI